MAASSSGGDDPPWSSSPLSPSSSRRGAAESTSGCPSSTEFLMGEMHSPPSVRGRGGGEIGGAVGRGGGGRGLDIVVSSASLNLWLAKVHDPTRPPPPPRRPTHRSKSRERKGTNTSSSSVLRRHHPPSLPVSPTTSSERWYWQRAGPSSSSPASCEDLWKSRDVGRQDSDSDESSVEDERLKALFDACDTDGDGYLTSANLSGLMSVLGMGGTEESLARDLGADRRGRISLRSFLQKRKELARQVHAIRSEGEGSWTPDMWSLGSEGGDTDSLWSPVGPEDPRHFYRDLEREERGGGRRRHRGKMSEDDLHLLLPPRGRRRHHIGNPSQPSSSASHLSPQSFHDCQVHLATLESLKTEILELSSRLQLLNQERDILEKTLTVTQLEKVRVERESEDKLDNQAARYEERLTELHSVIAELSRKIDQQRINVIAEEEVAAVEEYSHSELSHDQQDATDSTSEAVDSEEQMEEPRDHTATDASTSCDIDDRAVEAGEGIADLDVSECPRGSVDTGSCRASGDEDPIRSIGGLEEEVRALREENNGLQHALALSQHSNSSHRNAIAAMTQERDALCKKLREYQRMQPAMPPQALQVADAVTVRGLRGTPLGPFTSTSVGSLPTGSLPGGSGPSGSGPGTVSPSPSPQPHDNHTPTQEETPIICKLAERVRLKKAESGDLRITGSDLSSFGGWTTAVAEQLVAGVQEESDAQELYHALATAGGALAPHERLKEFEVEIERLHAKVDHLKAQNDVLAITLGESKAHCDRLSILIGKYESNSVALQLAVTNLDQTIEAYEVFVALLESEIALLLASCKAAGVGVKSSGGNNSGGNQGGWSFSDQEDLVALVRRAQEQRRSTENVARHLLSRLERAGNQSDTESWNETGTSHNTSNTSSTSSGVDSDVSRGEEQRLRETIMKLREERSNVAASVLPLEPVHLDPLTQHYPLSVHDAHKLDLENAVLMQELTAMREDRAELRAQVYLLEREKSGLELRIGTYEAQAAAYCATIDHLRSELSIARPNGEQEAEGEGDSGVDSSSPEIMEALRRERQLKTRVQDLVTTLEKVTKNSEARHMQSQEFINDLKKANGALLTAVDRLKKKYAMKVKRMEQQMMGMVDRHAHQVRVLKQRIAILEDDPNHHPPQMISTASETSL